jgi:hypothetical protein
MIHEVVDSPAHGRSDNDEARKPRWMRILAATQEKRCVTSDILALSRLDKMVQGWVDMVIAHRLILFSWDSSQGTIASRARHSSLGNAQDKHHHGYDLLQNKYIPSIGRCCGASRKTFDFLRSGFPSISPLFRRSIYDFPSFGNLKNLALSSCTAECEVQFSSPLGLSACLARLLRQILDFWISSSCLDPILISKVRRFFCFASPFILMTWG